MFYLVEGYQATEGERLHLGTPRQTSVVPAQQLLGAIEGMLRDGATSVVVSHTTEEVFMLFYQERSRRERGGA